MLICAFRSLSILLLSLMLFACGGSPQMDIEVNVTMNGKSLPHAKGTLDGKLLGETGNDGQFNGNTKQKPGKQLKLEVTAEVAGVEVKPWQSEFTVKLPNEGEILKYVFDADLKTSPYVVFNVQEKGAPVAAATVLVDKREVGKTDDKGAFVYQYKPGKNGTLLEVSKSGFSNWKQTAKLIPGAKFDVTLSRVIALNFEALKEEYGRDVGIGGITVSVDGKVVGKTNDAGILNYNYGGVGAKSVKVSYTATGYIPSQWATTMPLGEGTTLRHYFYPVAPKPIKVAVFNFAGNTPGVDLKEVATLTQSALRTQLFKQSVFREVAKESLDKDIKSANLNLAKMTSKGWQQTKLQSMVDMVVAGSVAQDADGIIIEAKFHSSSGKLIFSQVIRASGRGDINSATKEIALNVIERFPFEGTVTAIKDDRYEINLGKPYAISRGSEFLLLAAPGSKAPTSNTILTVKKSGDESSFAVLDDNEKTKVAVGDRVVRRVEHEGESSGSAREFFILSAKGGVGKEATPLSGVNIYLNNDWVGSTDGEGKAKVNIRLGKSFKLMLYRHGYQQVAEKINIEKQGDTKQFVLGANYAIFKVESTPSSATVYVDGESLGKTPMLDGKQVSLGFHTVRITAGENYRDWEEVVEFDKKIEDRTGNRKITLYKDYMKLGEEAEAKGNVDAAIAAYAAAVKGHPDYSDTHHRLAQLYLDEKEDYDGAIKEFENVLSLPENEQLIFKQYAVAYTNLGHAYYEKGSQKMSENRNDAAQLLAKAVQNLKVSKQNTRFFPADEYDQALHDTYYYLAMSYQKLYMLTNRSGILNDANLAWRDYFDFFPKSLESDPVFTGQRDTARKFWNQIKDK